MGTVQTGQDTASVAREVHSHVHQAGIAEALAFGGPYQSVLLKECRVLLQVQCPQPLSYRQCGIVALCHGFWQRRPRARLRPATKDPWYSKEVVPSLKGSSWCSEVEASPLL